MHDETWGHRGGHGNNQPDRAERRQRWARGEWGERGQRRGGRRGGWGGPEPFGPPEPFAGRRFGGPHGPFGVFGPGGPGGPGGPRFARGPRVRRGDVRAAILDMLAEGRPWNGYQLIQEIAARTDGVWRPSAGSVYPALQQLEDEGLVHAEAGDDKRRMYALTEAGQAYVEAHADELRSSWDAVTGSVGDAEFALRGTIKHVMIAVHQVAQAGTPAQVAQAAKILTDTRRALYYILAADDEPAPDQPAPDQPAGDEPGSDGAH